MSSQVAATGYAASPFESYPKIVEGIANDAKKSGYEVKIVPRTETEGTLVFQKYGITKKGHGLLGIPWEKRETWQLKYFNENNNTKFLGDEVTAEKKAPWLGDWRKYDLEEPVPLLPPNISIPNVVAPTLPRLGS